MKAIRLHAFGGPEALVYEDAPEPQPHEGEVLVRVHATAITPTEFAWEPTWRTRSGEARPFPIILGHEFSGVSPETQVPESCGGSSGPHLRPNGLARAL